MGYSSHRHHSAQKVSAHRVKHVLASGGCTPKKAGGGAVGHAERQAEHELRAMHAKPALHEAMKRGGKADPGRQPELTPESAEHGDVFTEGVRNSHRIPRRRGGKIPQINIVAIHHHKPDMAMGAAMPPQAPGMPAPPMGGPAPTLAPPGAPGMPPPMRKRGGKTKAGAFSGVGRLQMFHEMGGRDE
jgi:hypothetical protein